MRPDERTTFDRALQRARRSAYAPGEFVDQESFMRADEILALAVKAGIAPGVSVLDLCCGVAGPGRFITSELGCTYLGVDLSHGAVALALEESFYYRPRLENATGPRGEPTDALEGGSFFSGHHTLYLVEEKCEAICS